MIATIECTGYAATTVSGILKLFGCFAGIIICSEHMHVVAAVLHGLCLLDILLKRSPAHRCNGLQSEAKPNPVVVFVWTDIRTFRMPFCTKSASGFFVRRLPPRAPRR